MSSARRRRFSTIDALEPRRLLTNVTWDGGGDGINWTSANNWSGNVLPTSSDDVTIDIAGTPALKLITSQAVKSLTLNESLTISNSSTLSIVNNLALDSTLTLNIGNLRFTGTGTRTLTGTGGITAIGTTSNVLSNTTPTNPVTIGADIDFTLPSGPRMTIDRGFKLLGTAEASGTAIIYLVDPDNAGLIRATSGGTISVSGAYTTARLGDLRNAGGTVLLAGTLDNTAATFALDATTGSRTLSGKIVGGTIATPTGGATFALSGTPTFDGVQLDADLSINNAVALTIANGLTLNGTLSLSSALSTISTLTFTGAAPRTIGGTGAIIASNANSIVQLTNSGTGLVTVGPAITLTARTGAYLSFVSGFSLLGSAEALASSTFVFGNPKNGGIIRASGGTVVLSGAYTTADMGDVRNAGGTVTLQGTINNAGATLVLNDTTGSRKLQGRVNGGTISTAESATLTLADACTLDGVTLNADVTLNSYITLTILSSLTLNGTIKLNAGTTATSYLVFDGTTAPIVSGTGTILGAGGGAGQIQNSTPGLITIGAGLHLLSPVGGHLTLEAGFRFLGLAEAIGGTMAFVDMDNDGLILASSGATVSLNGNYSTADMGDIRNSGSTVVIQGTLNNAGATIALDAVTGSRKIAGRINGGTIAKPTGGAGFTVVDSTFDAVTNNADLSLSNYVDLTILNGLTLNATITLNAEGSGLLFNGGNQSVNGVGTIVAIQPAPSLQTFYTHLTSSAVVTLGPDIVLRSTTRMAIDVTENFRVLGLAEATGVGAGLSFTDVDNEGVIRATNGGAVTVAYTPSPAGTYAASGLWELIDGGVFGTVAATSILDIHLSIAGVGNSLGGGLNASTTTTGIKTLRNTTTFAPGAVLAVRPGGGTTTSNGTLRLAGTVDLGAGARLNITGGFGFSGTGQPTVRTAIGSGASAGRIVASGPVNLANADTGVVLLDVNLVGGYDPPANARFDLITGSSVTGDIGTFDGDVTPSGQTLNLSRDATNLYIGTGAAPNPTVVSTTFDYETRQAIVLRLDADVSASVARGDFVLVNRTSGQTVPTSVGSVSLAMSGTQITLDLSGQLADANYRLTVAADAIQNTSGKGLASPLTFDFFVLSGDANRDRVVDFFDLVIIAQSYGRAGKTFSQGNVDYSADGLVSFDDLVLLSQRYMSTLAAPANVAVRVTNVAAVSSKKRRPATRSALLA